MNLNPNAKRILIYGDSLPWGLIPGSTTFERFPINVRWPGALQRELGDDYEVIEECLCARTIDSDDPRPGFEGRNGNTNVTSVLDSHDPIDVIVLSLGLNEIKSIFFWTPEEVSLKIKDLIELIISRKPNFHETKPRVILCTQPEVQEDTGFWGDLWVGSKVKSVELAENYRKLSKELGVELFDINKLVKTGKDGVHLDIESHKIIAKELSELIAKG